MARARADDAHLPRAQDAGDAGGRHPLRPRRALHRAGRRPDHLRRPPRERRPAPPRRPAGLRPGLHARDDQHRPHPAVLPLLLGPGLLGRGLRAGGPASRPLGGHRGAGAPCPADVRRRLQPRLLQEQVVSGIPGRRPGVPGVLHRLQHPGRHRPRPSAPHPAPSGLGPPLALRHDRRGALRLDHLQPGPGGPRLPQPPGARGDRRGAAALRPPGGGPRPPRRRHLHLAGAGNPLCPPRGDPRPRPALPGDPRRCGAAGRPRHRDQRSPRGQRRLLRGRHQRSADGLQLRPAAPRPPHLPHRRHRPPRRAGPGPSSTSRTPRPTSTSSAPTTGSG